MPRVRGACPQGPRPTPRAHDYAGRCRLEPTGRILSPLSAGFFSLRTKRWALITRGFSPRVQQKIVYAGVENISYQQASSHLAVLSDLEVEPKPVERLVKEIGQERTDQRDAAVAKHQRLPLMAKDAVANPQRPCPQVAMVSVDGGRMQIRPEPSEAEVKRTSHWRESKVSVLETYQSEVYQADPDPDVPRCFLDLKRTMEVVRGLGHALPVGLYFEGEEHRAANRTEAPKTKGESARGSSGPARASGPQRSGQSGVQRRLRPDGASGGLGAELLRGRSAGLPGRRPAGQLDDPATAFLHVQADSRLRPCPELCVRGGVRGPPQAEGEEVYRRWIQAVWSGQVATILPELEARSADVGGTAVGVRRKRSAVTGFRGLALPEKQRRPDAVRTSIAAKDCRS